MTVTALTRVRRFGATHHYWRKDWSPERNQRVFGAQTEAHPHDYRVEVVVSGTPDPRTGFVVSLVELDRRLDEILEPLEGRSLNEAIPEVSKGEMLPSTESLAGWLWGRLEGTLPDSARLAAVRVWESDDLGAEVVPDGDRVRTW